MLSCLTQEANGEEEVLEQIKQMYCSLFNSADTNTELINWFRGSHYLYKMTLYKRLEK